MDLSPCCQSKRLDLTLPTVARGRSYISKELMSVPLGFVRSRPRRRNEFLESLGELGGAHPVPVGRTARLLAPNEQMNGGYGKGETVG